MASPATPPASLSEERNWAELPRDVLSVILKKLGAMDVLYRAQAVCKAWHSAAADPEFWRCVDMRLHADLFNVADLDAIARQAIDRAAGRLEEFYGYCCSDELLQYIADRTSTLKCLRLIASNISEEGLIEIARRFPMLEELEVTLDSIGDKWLESVAEACPRLKCLRANTERPYFSEPLDEYDSDTYAVAIVKAMPQLHKLQMVGNQMTNKGLLAILDNCTHLESLDIRRCYNVKLDENLKSRLAWIRDVRLPHDSTHDYEGIFNAADNEIDGEDAYSSDDHGYGFEEEFAYDDEDWDYDHEMAMLFDQLANGKHSDEDDDTD